jgi:hypothetical protein
MCGSQEMLAARLEVYVKRGNTKGWPTGAAVPSTPTTRARSRYVVKYLSHCASFTVSLTVSPTVPQPGAGGQTAGGAEQRIVVASITGDIQGDKIADNTYNGRD